MTRIHTKAVICVLLLVAVLAPTARPQIKCDKSVSPQPCPDQMTYTGTYRNQFYGFSIIIPTGLKGYWNSARCAPDEKYGCVCMSDHGRIIPLSQDAHIEAYTGYELFEWSAEDYERNQIVSLRKQQGIEGVRVLSSREVRLGNLKARRYVIEYKEKNKEVITERVVVVHKGVEYELILRTLPERYQRDRLQFERVVASWRLIRRRG